MSMLNTRAAAEIGDDALREVFARLPGLRDLLRCAATCQRWRRIVTDRDFLRRVGFWPDTTLRPCVLAGIFSQTYYAPGNYRTAIDFYQPPRFLSLQAGLDVHPRTFDSLVTIHGGNQQLFGHARPLAARRGFLLARVVLLSSSEKQQGDDDSGPQKLNLAVCRPMLDGRSTQLLPPTPFVKKSSFLDYSLEGCAIITATDHAVDDGSDLDGRIEEQEPMFQVLLIYKDDNNGFLCACTYSSDTPGRWSSPIKCCRASRLTRCGPRAGIVTAGTVRWLLKDHKTNLISTLNISVATSHVSLTNTPFELGEILPRPPIPCIAGEGRFSLVTIQDNGVASLWTKQEPEEDDHDRMWQKSQLTKLGNVRIDQVFFAESRGALLVEQGSAFSIIDLKNKEKMPLHLQDQRTESSRGKRSFPAASCSSTCCRGYYGDSICEYTTPVLYEMDWPFMSIVSSHVGDDI